MTTTLSFEALSLAEPLLQALSDLGYDKPTLIQQESIPILMAGNDLLAQADTGTGKTAAFALPILSHINTKVDATQALIIAPTRELAGQVADAFKTFAKYMPDLRVAPIYGGAAFHKQLQALKRGAHVIVGTPGRIIDHLDRGSLSLKSLKTVVLDEADEMLKMGFVEDIEYILEEIPNEHQTALFSATMPHSITKITNRYLNHAKRIALKSKKETENNIEQYYVRVNFPQKVEALTRIIEVENPSGMIIFARTKIDTTDIAQQLQGRGYKALALNGDMKQFEREKVVSAIKKGSVSIIVATDVAARGIDIEHLSHVVNFDIPHDPETYIHRIGRTGRAGRKGKALLFVTPKEDRKLRIIEKSIKKTIQRIDAPSPKTIQEERNRKLTERIINLTPIQDRLKPYHAIVNNIMEHSSLSIEKIAASLAYLIQEDNPMNVDDIRVSEPKFNAKSKKGKPSRFKKKFQPKRKGNSSKPAKAKRSKRQARG